MTIGRSDPRPPSHARTGHCSAVAFASLCCPDEAQIRPGAAERRHRAGHLRAASSRLDAAGPTCSGSQPDGRAAQLICSSHVAPAGAQWPWSIFCTDSGCRLSQCDQRPVGPTSDQDAHHLSCTQLAATGCLSARRQLMRDPWRSSCGHLSVCLYPGRQTAASETICRTSERAQMKEWART